MKSILAWTVERPTVRARHEKKPTIARMHVVQVREYDEVRAVESAVFKHLQLGLAVPIALSIAVRAATFGPAVPTRGTAPVAPRGGLRVRIIIYRDADALPGTTELGPALGELEDDRPDGRVHGQRLNRPVERERPCAMRFESSQSAHRIASRRKAGHVHVGTHT